VSPERIAYVLGVRVEEVPHHLVTLPAWDPRPSEKAPHGRVCVRVTALARRAHGLRAAVFEAVAVELAKPGRAIPARGPFYVRYTRVTSRVIWDPGNLPASVKAVEDQMCACIGVDDGSPMYQGAYTQEPRRGRPEGVRIEVWGTP
jgi:hypothetical protein